MRVLLIGFMALVPGISVADVSLIYPQTVQCKSNVSGIQIANSRMRFDSVMENRKYSMLFDGMEEIITTLDHAEQQYFQTEVDEDALDYNKDVMSSAGTFMDKQMQAMQAQMKQQCADMEKQGFNCGSMSDLASMMKNTQAMMGSHLPKVEIKPSDKTQTVMGMTCKTFDRYENSSKIAEECYIEPKDLLLSEKDKKHLLRNMKVMLHYGNSMSGFAEKMKAITHSASVQTDPADKDVLLSKICFAPDGSETGRVEVQINNEVIDEVRFDIPPGYQATNMMGDR
jgi:hypothetical protein